MKKLLVLLLIAFPAWADSPKTITSSVAFQDSQGNALVNGKLTLRLSQNATVVSGGGLVAPLQVSISLDSSGKIPSGTLLWANDQLTPSGTVYYARLFTSKNLLAADYSSCPWSISGSSPIDLSAMTCTTTGASYPSITSASLSANNTWTGIQTFSQPIVSTVSTGTAPFTVSSTTAVTNLNASFLLGKTWAIPAAIGSTTPAAGTFTSLTGSTFYTSGGSAPSVSCAGLDTGTCVLLTGSTNSSGTIQLQPNGSPGYSGTAVITFGGGFGATNGLSCVFTLDSTSTGAWNQSLNIAGNLGPSNVQVAGFINNTHVEASWYYDSSANHNLTAGLNYNIDYICIGH